MADHRKTTLLLGVALFTFAATAPRTAQAQTTPAMTNAVQPDPNGGDAAADTAQDIVVTGKTTR